MWIFSRWNRKRENCRLICHVDASFTAPTYAFRVELGGRKLAQDSGVIPLPGFNSMVMEYLALIRLLEHLIAHEHTDRAVTIRTDARYVADQLNEVMRVKSRELKPLYIKAKALMGAFNDIHVEWIARERNGETHREAAKQKIDLWMPAE